jgi:NAD-dependent SIR2 family protein deacetylase
MYDCCSGGQLHRPPLAQNVCDNAGLRIRPEFMPIEADDFARRFTMRAANLMWLLGAGCSASAGIPTAGDMVWEFKQQLYVSQRRVSLKSVSDLSNPVIREQLQSYIDASGRFPASGAADEYAALFETVWPHEGDRRAYLDGKSTGAKPCYGHYALATLMCAGLAKLAWTTNFDSLIADACAKIYDSTGPLTTVALDAPDLANEAINAQRWPIEIKLHGDFRSRRLKNTGDELRQQDARLRQVLVDSCRRSGLVVAGYSGRDDSVMDALSEALSHPSPFPAGLFWLHRGDDPSLPRVQALLQLAAEHGVDGGLVRIENFDEVMRDLVRLVAGLNTAVLDSFGLQRQRWSASARAGGTKGFPAIRLNALPIVAAPTVCRRVVCKIGGHAETAEAVRKAGVNVLVGRKRAGVLAFGSDADVRAAFGPSEIAEFDLYPIEAGRLRYDSAERGLLREAMSRALAREHDLDLTRRRSADLLAPADPDGAAWAPLKKIVGVLSGSVAGHLGIKWREGIGTRLDWADDRLWLLVEPRTVFKGVTADNRSAATDFGRERTVKRYNRQLNELISFWAGKLAKNGEELRALGVDSGVDAVFRLNADTAFSWRIRA